MIEQNREVGGACVYQGTIPSKTLRESTLQIVRFQRSTDVFDFKLRDDVKIASLMKRLDHVVRAHGQFMKEQLARNQIDRFHGRARFLSKHEVGIRGTDGDGTLSKLTADYIIVATGSRPRVPDNIPVDHEHMLDSDSILSLVYVPKSLTVLGGFIASEYASIFSLLGVQVTMIDAADRPLRFLDQEFTNQFCDVFQESGGRYLGRGKIKNTHWDGISKVTAVLENDEIVESEKMLVALGRTANLENLGLEAAGLSALNAGSCL